MKQFLTLLYICLTAFAIIGGLGYCFWVREPQFGVALSILGVVLGLGFFKVIEIPTKDWMEL